jgi:hypothetical protein
MTLAGEATIFNVINANTVLTESETLGTKVAPYLEGGICGLRRPKFLFQLACSVGRVRNREERKSLLFQQHRAVDRKQTVRIRSVFPSRLTSGKKHSIS